MPIGETVIVRRITEDGEEEPQLLGYYYEKGLLPGATLTMLEQALYAGTVTVRKEGSEMALGVRAAQELLVALSIEVRIHVRSRGTTEREGNLLGGISIQEVAIVESLLQIRPAKKAITWIGEVRYYPIKHHSGTNCEAIRNRRFGNRNQTGMLPSVPLEIHV